MQYRWRVWHLQFKPGDPVPEAYGSGIVATLLRARQIEEAPVEMKAIERPPADKQLHPETTKVRRKKKAISGAAQ